MQQNVWITQKTMQHQKPKPDDKEIISIFGKGPLKDYLKEKISNLEEELLQIETHIKDTQFFIDTQCARETPMHWWKESYIEFILTPKKEGLEKYIKACEFKLASFKKQKPSVGSGVSDVEIARAKEVPIGSILGTDKTMIKCPLHNETSASFKIYTKDNRWWCFGENVGGDAIELLCKMNNLSFIDAVKKLSK